MLTFARTMDKHSWDVYKDGKRIGNILWHPGRSPRFEISSDVYFIDLDDLESIAAQLRKEAHG